MFLDYWAVFREEMGEPPSGIGIFVRFDSLNFGGILAYERDKKAGLGWAQTYVAINDTSNKILVLFITNIPLPKEIGRVGEDDISQIFPLPAAINKIK